MSRVVHFEIHTEDPERCVKFYNDVFGWDIKKWDGPVDYWMVMTGPSDKPGINGGLFIRKGPRPIEKQAINAYVCTMEVENIDATIEKALSAGATMDVSKQVIPHVGYIAYLKDVDLNFFGLMQSDPSVR